LYVYRKKEWSVGTLDDAIKSLDDNKRETSLARKASAIASPIEQQLTEQYMGIPHFKLLQDIKKYYDDPKLIAMLERIITNPIDAPRGYKNPMKGIALRGPLSQFFSGIYLKPLDDAFLMMDVTYLRFQDDVLILCKTKRQMNRCRRRMMDTLQERHLTLSVKKSRMGNIETGFHYLGIQYSPTQTENITKGTHKNDAQYLDEMGGG
jgi:RNA-directed DNA polymerase